MSTSEFNDLLLRNSDFLQPFATTLTKDQDTARDLLQDTMYRALINKDKYHVGTNIKAWLFTIMRNIFINGYRRRNKQPVVYDNTPGGNLIDNNQHTVSNGAETNLMLKEIQTAIYRLPAIFKQPFMLYFDGYKYHEIAHLLSEPLGTIKSRIHFTRKVLKTQVSRY